MGVEWAGVWGRHTGKSAFEDTDIIIYDNGQSSSPEEVGPDVGRDECRGVEAGRVEQELGHRFAVGLHVAKRGHVVGEHVHVGSNSLCKNGR